MKSLPFLLLSLMGFALQACGGYTRIGPEQGFSALSTNFGGNATAKTGSTFLHLSLALRNSGPAPVFINYESTQLLDKNSVVIQPLDPSYVAQVVAHSQEESSSQYVPPPPPEPVYQTQALGSFHSYGVDGYYHGTGDVTAYTYETQESQFARAVAPGAHALGYALGSKLGEAMFGAPDTASDYLRKALRPQPITPGTAIEGTIYYMKPDSSRYPLMLKVAMGEEILSFHIQ